MAKKLIILVVLIAIVALLVVFGNKPSEETYASLVEESDAVLIADQQPDEETVSVAYVKLSKPGYVSIYETTPTGGRALIGTSDLLLAGEYTNIVVRHRGRNSNSPNTVTAVVVHDDGDEVFDESVDSEAVVDGEAVESEAVIDENAVEVTEEDLPDLLEEEGYTVVLEEEQEEVIDEILDEEVVDESEDAMMEGDSMMEDDSMVEGESTSTEAAY